ncbi:MAG: alpha/beta hydrolase [Mojavia pulchra JT2-VF2]|jgi:predicted dienelactone hydrolase|uniref:Alpha/beta hydrolase n=1 Tax=Mojavia pulchra JT2-VF2 TaxID=287848 RepID=A0A951Q109_9NOST|nr:alpha/beta hydrolase [Mojavia pulchra JT2-VF2]
MISSFGKGVSTLRRSSLLLALSMLLPTFGISDPVMAAERIYGSYSALKLSISVTSLENYAKNGVIDDNLAVYQRYLPPKQLEELRRILLTPVKVSPVVVSQFLYTPQGEFLLRRLAETIKTKTHQPQQEFQTLRSAFISASAEPGGLTLLNLLRKYPSSSINLDLVQSLGIAADLKKIVNETSQAIAAVTEKSKIEVASQKPVNVSQLPDLRQQGKFKSQKYTLKFFDLKRKRRLLTDLYLPNIQSPAPVIVISHGLGTDSSNFRYLAAHLASYGFAVVVPNHSTSDTKRSLTNRQANKVVQSDEFTDRPLDVKYILDQLEKANQSDSRFKGKLNLEQVGIFGQSLGGYTALALAGAQINFEQLQKDCHSEVLQNTWNMSLLLQCQALTLSNKQFDKNHNLRDERVKAAIAVNPITSSIFGKAGLSQIQIPVMVVGSSDDTVAPALFEQILPFSWFTNSHKYLVMLVGATHFSTIGDGNSANQPIGSPSQVIGDHPAQARRYMNALSLPFFQTYVAGSSQYFPYLNAAYAKAISSQPLSLSFVQSLNSTELAQTPDTDVKGAKSSKKFFPTP